MFIRLSGAFLKYQTWHEVSGKNELAQTDEAGFSGKKSCSTENSRKPVKIEVLGAYFGKYTIQIVFVFGQKVQNNHTEYNSGKKPFNFRRYLSSKNTLVALSCVAWRKIIENGFFSQNDS